MNRSYWENIAPAYNEEIFDVLANDKKKLIASVIRKNSSKNKTVIDIGCAIGKWLPLLSPSFKKVYALDISQKNLRIAEKGYPLLKNVVYIRADMSRPALRLPMADLGICINALLTPSDNSRKYFLRNMAACIRKNGRIVLTVPAMESWMLTGILQHQFKIDAALFPAEKNRATALKKWLALKKGIVAIDHVFHKHFLREELAILLQREKFSVERIQKIEYDWKTEFHAPPRWLKEPRPWDWMVVATRT
jgi:SAM-dependent methyltransferase